MSGDSWVKAGVLKPLRPGEEAVRRSGGSEITAVKSQNRPQFFFKIMNREKQHYVAVCRSVGHWGVLKREGVPRSLSPHHLLQARKLRGIGAFSWSSFGN